MSATWPTTISTLRPPAIGGRPPHILHVCPSFGIGGAETRTSRLINHFADRFRHTILSLSGDLACADRLDPGLAIKVEAAGRGGRQPVSRMRDISARLRALAPDLLITYNWGSIEWAAVNRICKYAPHVHIEDGFGPGEILRCKARRSWFRRWALARSHALIVPSTTLHDIARREWGMRDSRLVLITNGIDMAQFTPPRPDGNGSVIVIGTIAALRPEKNIARLLRTFVALGPDLPVRLLIAGDGGERAALEALARSLDVDQRVRFLGPTSEAERFLRGLDIFAITSDTEQLPTTVIEAMASGLPIAGIAVGDVARMVCEANRPLIVAREDEAGLTAAMRRLATEPALRRVIGEASRREAESRFGEAAMLEAHERLYRSARRPTDRHPAE